MWLEQRPPRWRPKPQGSPSSNRKHLFRSDNSAECLWGPDIKRTTKDDVGRKRDADRERGDEATARATDDALRRRNDRSFCPDGLQQRQEEVSRSKTSSKLRWLLSRCLTILAAAGFTCLKRRVPVPAYTDRIHQYFTDELTVWNAIIH